ncbi:hypothetical protein DCC62_04045 [candidate division KSB1 bacterium]|nr:MAG: hypothetical protein DCC62_04045 [candidate division KSB1 bacterium]
MNGRRNLKLCVVLAMMFLGMNAGFSQTPSASVHEIAPYIGFYAPDRFETSFNVGLRYFYSIDRRFGVGAVLGFARAQQEFLKRQLDGAALVAGSDRVVFHGARAVQYFPSGKVEPYLAFHLGLTRFYGENSLTYGFGAGTKVAINQKFSFRYEFFNYIFSNGRDAAAWTNKNIEVAFMLGYHL